MSNQQLQGFVLRSIRDFEDEESLIKYFESRGFGRLEIKGALNWLFMKKLIKPEIEGGKRGINILGKGEILLNDKKEFKKEFKIELNQEF